MRNESACRPRSSRDRLKRFMLAAALISHTPSVRAEGPVIDLHVHLHRDAQSLREYRSQNREASIEVAAFGAMWFGGDRHALQGDVAATRAANDSLLDLARRDVAMIPIVTVHPYDGDAALAELDRSAAAGARGLKIHPHTQRFDAADPRVLALVRRAGMLGLVVIIDNANILPGDSEKLFNLALAASDTTFVFAHMGGMHFRFWNVLKAARTAEGLVGNNIHFDISAMVTLAADSPIEDEFVWTIRNVGVETVLLGSDYPQFSLAQNLDALERLGLSEAEVTRIRFQNARDLFARDSITRSGTTPRR